MFTDQQRKKNLRRSVTLWLGLKRLFKQFLLLFFVSQMAFGLFRATTALGRNMIVANTFGSFAVLTLLALGGFILSRKDIKSWWIWGYWISPLMYGQNALMANEFLGNSWHNATFYLGKVYLDTCEFFPHAYWYWIGLDRICLPFEYVVWCGSRFNRPWLVHHCI